MRATFPTRTSRPTAGSTSTCSSAGSGCPSSAATSPSSSRPPTCGRSTRSASSSTRSATARSSPELRVAQRFQPARPRGRRSYAGRMSEALVGFVMLMAATAACAPAHQRAAAAPEGESKSRAASEPTAPECSTETAETCARTALALYEGAEAPKPELLDKVSTLAITGCQGGSGAACNLQGWLIQKNQHTG